MTRARELRGAAALALAVGLAPAHAAEVSVTSPTGPVPLSDAAQAGVAALELMCQPALAPHLPPSYRRHGDLVPRRER